MKNILIVCMVFVVVAFCATSAWAAASQTVTVNATIPTITGGLTLGISKITGTVWTKDQTAISFGTLTWNPELSIFLASSYFAVDIGVVDNSGTIWTLTHTRTNLANGVNNLNSKVNVSFVKETDPTGVVVGTVLQKVSYGNSNSIAYNKTALAGGWLRILYGVGTGSGDATGVTPIGLDTPAGTYTGSVTITLTP